MRLRMRVEVTMTTLVVPRVRLLPIWTTSHLRTRIARFDRIILFSFNEICTFIFI